MTWARFDDGFHDHPKISKVGNAGAGLFAKLITWSCRHLTNGHVTGDMATTLAGSDGPELVERLVRHRLLVRVGDDYRIHDFEHYQLDGDKERASRSRKAANQKASRDRKRSSSLPTSPPRDPSVTGDVATTVTGDVAVTSPVTIGVPVSDSDHKDSLPADAHARNGEPSGPTAQALLAELRAHPELAALATRAVAERYASLADGGSKKLGWLLAAVRDLAGAAGTAADAGAPMGIRELTEKLRHFCNQASERPPKPNGQPRASPRHAAPEPPRYPDLHDPEMLP